ncbi:unnamed protein product, partial [Mesorhabditis spiculigera]
MRLLALVLLIPGCYALWCYQCYPGPKGDPCLEGGPELAEEEDVRVQCGAGERCIWSLKKRHPLAFPDERRECGTMGPHRCGHIESDDKDVGNVWWCACDTDFCNTGSFNELKATVAAYSPTPSPSPPRPASPELSKHTTHEKGRCGVPGQYCQMNAKFFHDVTRPPLIERYCVEGDDPTCTINPENDGFLVGCGCDSALCNDWDEITLKKMAEALLEHREGALNITSPLPVVPNGTTYYIHLHYIFIFLLAFS